MPNPCRLPARPARHRRAGRLVAHVLVLLALVPAAARAQATPERYSLPGSQVTLYNLAGEVTLEPTDGANVTVEVRRGGGDGARLKVATGQIAGRQTLRVIYPEHHIVYPAMGHGSRTNLRVRSDGTFGDKTSGMWPAGDQFTISGSGSGLEAHADLIVRVPKGREVVVRLATGTASASKVDSRLSFDLGSGEVTTADTRGGLTIDTGSGDVHVEGVEGELTADTGSGSVSVARARGGSISVDTGSGDVSVREVEVPELTVDTGSGGVTLEGIHAPRVTVDTGSGGVEAELLAAIEALSIDTGSGSVVVRVPEDIGAMVALETGSGGLDVELPVKNLHRDHGELRAQIGDGHGRIDIETGSGGIRIAGR